MYDLCCIEYHGTIYFIYNLDTHLIARHNVHYILLLQQLLLCTDLFSEDGNSRKKNYKYLCMQDIRTLLIRKKI
jgi:hypothetical protein